MCESMLRAAFAGLEAGRLVNLRGIRFRHLARLRYGTPIPNQNGQGQLVAVDIVKGRRSRCRCDTA